MFSFMLEVAARVVELTAALVFGIIKGIFRVVGKQRQPDPVEETHQRTPWSATTSQPSAPVAAQPHITTHVHVHLPPGYAPAAAPSYPSAQVAGPQHFLSVADNRIYITQASVATQEHPISDVFDEDTTRILAIKLHKKLADDIANVRLDESALAEPIVLPPLQGLALPSTDGELWIATPEGFTHTEAPALTLPEAEPDEPEPAPALWQILHEIPATDGHLWVMTASGVARV